MKIKLDKLDILFSRYIRLRADGVCEYCGRYVGYARLQVSHFHGRRKASVRYDEENCSCVCFSCHMYLGENPFAHTEFFRKRLGSERFEMLNIRANATVTPGYVKTLKEALTLYYKEKIKLLEASNDTDMG